jgi:hypothetical protein
MQISPAVCAAIDPGYVRPHLELARQYGVPFIGGIGSNSNIEACYPVSAPSAMFGYDSHSAWYRIVEGLAPLRP